MSPFLAWGDFHVRSRFARSTVPEEKWGTTRSVNSGCPFYSGVRLIEVSVKTVLTVH